MSLKALIFDVDGTLADTEEAHRLAFNEAFGALGLDWHWSKSLYSELLRTTGGKERIAAYINTLGVPAVERAALMDRIDALHAAKTAAYARVIRSGTVRLREGVARLFDEAAQAGVRLGIATTTTFANIETLLSTSLGGAALDRFAVIGAGDDAARKKPAPDIYEVVLERLGLNARECVALEDSANGLRAAKGAGLYTIVTPSYWTLGENFSDADLVLPSLGSPERPLPPAAAALVGNSVLGVADIARRLEAARVAP